MTRTLDTRAPEKQGVRFSDTSRSLKHQSNYLTESGSSF